MTWIRKDRIWPTIVITVLTGTVVMGVVLGRVAIGDNHFAVEPDYYNKAVGWDSTMAQGKRNDSLGWQVIPRIGPIPPRGSVALELEIVDGRGEALTGARVSVEAMPIAYANRVVDRVLPPAELPGHYAAPVTMSPLGLWEFRVTATRADARFTANLRLELSAAHAATVVASRPGDALR
ncbi:MAG: FixH family protein [Gemmatimonadales bacterium]